ncbi:putative Rab-GTPase-TBC domain-containing protein [Medicago truncatula]|uniref:Putative Rab-GTPase-TBC domain-containing protein n=1 Tax=Medicago truncatula TaxID=3880 RepID=G7J869_MEDTR|nr:rab GTPase-activating protein 22 isoform X2 [Medicago truncatula]AES72567.1 Rab GTPase activator [Medicago truncatula]RHN69684.1 putative Rab-GTPase-TBC domain-containing protein [Medicago truncatula]
MNPLRRSNNSSSSSSNNSSPSSSSSNSSWIHLRSVLFVVTSSSSSSPASCSSSDRGRLKSPWSRRKRKRVLSPQQWKSLFAPDGRIRDRGMKFLKRVRSGGVDPSIRAEVWPFLLGVYDLDTTKEERDVIRTQNRKKYEKLRRQCRQLLKSNSGSFKLIEIGEINYEGDGVSFIQDSGSPSSEDAASARESLSSGEQSPDFEYSDDPSVSLLEGDDAPSSSNADASALDTDSTDSDSSESPEVFQTFPSDDGLEENNAKTTSKDSSSPSQMKGASTLRSREDFATWQRIIRLDAVRANAEWMPYSPSQAVVPESRAHRSAEAVGLKDYGHLDAGRIFHAARLVAILEAYALYDPEIGYCQGMSDLLSPIICVVSEDHEAFWCFVGFMKKARQNFRLDEVGIRRQLDIVAKIIKFKDSHLFRHLEKLQAEDCFFVYRMVVVLFRRELTFEQTLCLWEVMWADQAAIRAGIGKSPWSRIRQRAPPTDDLLLFAIAASVLQRRKLILEKYSSMDDILKECNGMAGHLDVWKLLDDAHNLVVTLHDKMKIEASFQ